MSQTIRLSVFIGFLTILLACAFHSHLSFPFFSSSINIGRGIPPTATAIHWYHPDAYIQSSDAFTGSNDNVPWIHRHLGGNGPWVQNNHSVGVGIAPAPGCRIDQIHLIGRHTDRFPTTKSGGRMLQLLERLQNPAITTSGDLAFVKDWQFFTSEPMADFEQLTRSGPYAGTLTAFTTGVRMRTRYNNLLEHHFSSVNKKLHLWASDSARVVETAKYFAAGLLGLDWEDIAVLIVIPETAERGGNTLTPGDTCIRYLSDLKLGHNQGYKRLAAFTDTYLPIVATRLEGFIHNQVSKIPFKLSKSEVYAMQEMCGFEIMARGSSPWCNVFSQDEWRQFAYARDILHYYRAGPGTPYSVSMGGLYLNATARLLLQGPEAGSLFFSFVHDGDIAPVLSALHIFDDDHSLPITHMKTNRTWRASEIMPMGARIIFERMSCQRQSLLGSDETFVRININDGITVLPDCQSGPGQSCPLQEFVIRLDKHQKVAGDFRTVCGLDANAPEHITFLHQ